MDQTIKGHSVVVAYAEEIEDLTTVDATTVMTDLALLVDADDLPGEEADDIDISHMLTPGQAREYAAGWSEAGEVSLTLQYTPEQQTTVIGLFRQRQTFRVLYEDGSGDAFTGYIKSYGKEVDREGIITQAVTMKISGKPESFEPAAAP